VSFLSEEKTDLMREVRGKVTDRVSMLPKGEKRGERREGREQEGYKGQDYSSSTIKGEGNNCLSSGGGAAVRGKRGKRPEGGYSYDPKKRGKKLLTQLSKCHQTEGKDNRLYGRGSDSVR